MDCWSLQRLGPAQLNFGEGQRASALAGARWRRWEERLDHLPQRVVNQLLCHAVSILAQAFLLVALRNLSQEIDPDF